MQSILELYLKFDEILNNLYSNYEWFQLKSPKGSISNSELFFIYCEIHKSKPQIVFESGVATGRSTIVLAHCMEPFGEVISALFKYPEDEDVHPFVCNNLTIIPGRGEEVVKEISTDKKLMAVIDGPKPDGYLFGRPGWTELMDELVKYDALRGIFQHDVVGKGEEKFKNYYSTNLRVDFSYLTIDKSFLEKFSFYGDDHDHKESLVFLKRDCKKWLL